MKQIYYFMITILLLSGLCLSDAKALKPDSYIKRISLEVSEKSYTYYSFSGKKPLDVKLKGPQRIKVYLRGSEDCRNISYDILIDGKIIQTGNLKEQYSRNKFRDNDLKITQAKVFTVKIPNGEHNFTIKPSRKCQLYSRLVELDEELLSFAPTESYKARNLVVNEKEYDYYFCTKENPVEVSIIGPTTLTVFARLNYTKEMRGIQHFTIIVKNDNETNVNYKLEATISEVSYYKDEKELLPSKAEKFTIKVNEGSNKIKFYLGDSAATTAALRIFVPESALNR